MKKYIKVIMFVIVVIAIATSILFFKYKADENTAAVISNTASVTYEDSLGSSYSLSSNTVTTEITSATVSEKLISSSSYDTGWNMISFPEIENNSDKSFIPNTYKVREFDPISNEYINPSNLKTGKGYWIKVDDVSGMKDKKYFSNQFNSITSDISKGWNLLGNPFSSDLSVSGITIIMKDGTAKSIDQAKEDKDILGYFWSYEVNDKAYVFVVADLNKYKTSAKKQSFISPYRGFWIYVKNNNVASVKMSK